MATKNETADTLNSLLRGEISAVETYRQAEEKFNGETEASTLKRMAQDHQEAVGHLRHYVHREGADPSDTSGAWGTFAQIVEGGAKVFGKTAALKALKEGEEHGINSYRSALDDTALPAESRVLIRDTLLPQCQQHVQMLDKLMSQQ